MHVILLLLGYDIDISILSCLIEILYCLSFLAHFDTLLKLIHFVLTFHSHWAMRVNTRSLAIVLLFLLLNRMRYVVSLIHTVVSIWHQLLWPSVLRHLSNHSFTTVCSTSWIFYLIRKAGDSNILSFSTSTYSLWLLFHMLLESDALEFQVLFTLFYLLIFFYRSNVCFRLIILLVIKISRNLHFVGYTLIGVKTLLRHLNLLLHIHSIHIHVLNSHVLVLISNMASLVLVNITVSG